MGPYDGRRSPGGRCKVELDCIFLLFPTVQRTVTVPFEDMATMAGGPTPAPPS